MTVGWTDYTNPDQKVDIAAQTLTTVKVDILAQALANLKVDLNAQTLAQATTRDSQGTYNFVSGTTTAVDGVTTSLLTVSGKGRLQGLTVYADHTASAVASYVKLILDGGLPVNLAWSTWNFYQFLNQYDAYYRLTGYDTTNHIYAMRMPGNIAFESSLTLQYWAISANASVFWTCTYSLL